MKKKKIIAMILVMLMLVSTIQISDNKTYARITNTASAGLVAKVNSNGVQETVVVTSADATLLLNPDTVTDGIKVHKFKVTGYVNTAFCSQSWLYSSADYSPLTYDVYTLSTSSPVYTITSRAIYYGDTTSAGYNYYTKNSISLEGTAINEAIAIAAAAKMISGAFYPYASTSHSTSSFRSDTTYGKIGAKFEQTVKDKAIPTYGGTTLGSQSGTRNISYTYTEPTGILPLTFTAPGSETNVITKVDGVVKNPGTQITMYGGSSVVFTVKDDSKNADTGTITATLPTNSFVDTIYYFNCTSGDGNNGYSSQSLIGATYKTKTFNMSFSASPLTGGFSINKYSTITSCTDGNAGYSLEGAEYGVYRTNADAAADTNRVATMTTDANGNASISGLVYGTYYVKEVKASKGYILNGNIYPKVVNGTSATETALALPETPAMDPAWIILSKKDNDNVPIADAQFTIKYYDAPSDMTTDPALSGYSAKKTWVMKTDSTGFVNLDNAHKVSGDSFYINSLNGVISLPVGIITIQETYAPEDYVIDNTVYVRQVKQQGSGSAVVTYNPPQFSNTEKFGRIIINKKGIVRDYNEADNSFTDRTVNLSDIQFGIYAAEDIMTPNGTLKYNNGELVTTVTTDSNGNAATGNLYIGKYTVKEISSSANEGFILADDEEVILSITSSDDVGTYVYETVNLVNMPKVPEIHTTAYDSDTLEHIARPKENARIIDKVEYTNLITGAEYEVSGELRVVSTGEILKDEVGNPIISTKTFRPEASDGYVELEYNFDATLLNGETVVVFETLSKNNKVVATHKDLNDYDQSIFYPDIHTEMTDDKSKTHNALAGGIVELTDTVYFSNLIPDGREYELKAELYVKSTGEILKNADGTAITSSAKFVPGAAEGEAEVKFTFLLNPEILKGETINCFEHLYYNNIEIATHADIDDYDQSIYFPEIRTKLTDNTTGNHNSLAGSRVKLTDTVYYNNLEPSKEYEVKGELYVKSTGELLKNADGTPITSSAKFVPEAASGKVTVTFEFDAPIELQNETVNCFEHLYRNNVEIATHTDIDDYDQSTFFPSVYSVASDSVSGNHSAERALETKIIDSMKLDNLIVNEKYVIRGIIYDRDKNAPLLIDGVEGATVTCEYSFTADKKTVTFDMEYNFNSIHCLNTTAVILCELYLVREDGTEILVATHKDIDNKEQTVYFDNKVGTLTLSDYLNPSKAYEIINTGDFTPIYLYCGIMVLSFGGFFIFARKLRKKGDDE